MSRRIGHSFSTLWCGTCAESGQVRKMVANPSSRYRCSEDEVDTDRRDQRKAGRCAIADSQRVDRDIQEPTEED